MQTQCNQILDYMKQGYSISSWGAIEKFRCTRLASRIVDIKKMLNGTGLSIKTDKVFDPINRKRYVKYSLQEV